MNTKAFFPFWEGSNLILGIGKENQIIFLRTPAAVNFFHQILTIPTTPPTPPQRKIGVLMPDISWAPPDSLPIR